MTKEEAIDLWYLFCESNKVKAESKREFPRTLPAGIEVARRSLILMDGHRDLFTIEIRFACLEETHTTQREYFFYTQGERIDLSKDEFIALCIGFEKRSKEMPSPKTFDEIKSLL